MDICPSDTKAEKEVGKNIGRSEERNKTTAITGKNEVSKFTRFDQRVLAEIQRHKSGKGAKQKQTTSANAMIEHWLISWGRNNKLSRLCRTETIFCKKI